MTVLDASLKLYNWFADNDSVILDRDFQKIILISDNEKEDRACFAAALKDLEGQGMLAREEYDGVEYWILKQSFSSFEQNIKMGAHICKAIAEEINLFCDQIGDDTDRCDVTDLAEKDIINLLFMYQHLKNSGGIEGLPPSTGEDSFTA